MAEIRVSGHDFFPFMVAALTVYREASGEDYSGKLAVASVIRNRQKNPRWPDSLDEVCLQKKQFSCYNRHDKNVTKWPKRSHQADWQAFLDSIRAVEESRESDPTNGANHYYASYITPPRWAAKMTVTARIGRHIFLKG